MLEWKLQEVELFWSIGWW